MKTRVIAATRESAATFAANTLLGRSLALLGTHHPGLLLDIAYNNRRGLPEVYNAALARARDEEFLLFVHDDVAFDDWLLMFRVVEALRHYDLVGVAGCRSRVPAQAGWMHLNTALEMLPRAQLSGFIANPVEGGLPQVSVFGESPAAVSLLDGVFLAARAGVLKGAGLRFDPRFDFHFYDIDFCRSAEACGLRLGTWPIALTHASRGHFTGEAWRRGHDLYIEKWGS